MVTVSRLLGRGTPQIDLVLHAVAKCNDFKILFFFRFSFSRRMQRILDASIRDDKAWFSRNFRVRLVTSKIKSNESGLFCLFWKKGAFFVIRYIFEAGGIYEFCRSCWSNQVIRIWPYVLKLISWLCFIVSIYYIFIHNRIHCLKKCKRLEKEILKKNS